MHNVKSTSFPNGWVRAGNVFAFPHDWQMPAKTELWAYEKLLAEPDFSLFKQYICFPWASLVDYLDHNPVKAAKLLTAIENRPPQMGVEVVTYCQHIYALKLLPYFKQFGITDIYWSHKVKGQDEVEGIRLHPYPLYPVMHHKRKQPYKNKPLKERKYLYSFIGAYQPELYLSEARKWIFDLPKRDDAIVIERSEWHFEQDVYRDQLRGESEAEAKRKVREKQEREYMNVMEETVYCLCPSGSGPNSIRLWEAIEFGCIPVILSDNLDTAILSHGQYRYKQVRENNDALDLFLKSIGRKL
ncbi:TPA: exostosin family protein [Vibrio parahaemolyticus]|nr:exostosin family protein [Vibrio parahaemolyticus]HCG6494756.1 exostosin family protein [Vibrio parahaemolyticus]